MIFKFSFNLKLKGFWNIGEKIHQVNQNETMKNRRNLDSWKQSKIKQAL